MCLIHLGFCKSITPLSYKIIREIYQLYIEYMKQIKKATIPQNKKRPGIWEISYWSNRTPFKTWNTLLFLLHIILLRPLLMCMVAFGNLESQHIQILYLIQCEADLQCLLTPSEPHISPGNNCDFPGRGCSLDYSIFFSEHPHTMAMHTSNFFMETQPYFYVTPETPKNSS